MQQAARVSQLTAFFHLGTLVEYRRHRRDVHRAAGKAHAGLHHRPLRLSRRRTSMSDHIVKAYDEDLAQLKTMLAQMGGLVEQQLDDAIDALSRRDTALADRVIQNDEKRRRAGAPDRGEGDPHHRQAPADGARPARDHGGDPRRLRPRAHRRPCQEHGQAHPCHVGPAAAQADDGRHPHGPPGAGGAQEHPRCLFALRCRDGAWRSGARTRSSTRSTIRSSANSSPT